MVDAAPDTASADLKARNKRLSLNFRVQHGIVVAFFLLILIFHALAIYLFCSGFLLSRLVLQDRSECAIPPVDLSHSVGTFTPGSQETGCWHPKTFDKAVVIIVDALRYDFTVPFQPKSTNDPPHYFHDALPILYETSVREPQNAFLRPFIADPPTTTLQRLKGLTTGTLPTFIDAGSNFAGTAIDEDNLVEQLFKAGKKVVHLGDDTWHSLFPGYFEPNLTRAYDSFNVWDLHTVDNGVNEHLFPLLQPSMKGRWDVIFGHYLGVDHAGHRYGPDHPAMAEKLKQMDGVFRRMIETLDDDTLLVVMGDHGMDVKGDHGGESDDEVQAALWMYSKAGVFGRKNEATLEPPAHAKIRPTAQIDLVPTLSLLLGLPVPFNNLGAPIEEAFHGSSKVTEPNNRNLAEVARLTAAQIHRYQGEYAKARGLGEAVVHQAEKLWQAANEKWETIALGGKSGLQSTNEATYVAYGDYQTENLSICKALWARFDLVSMAMGIITLVGTFAAIVMYAQAVNDTCDRAALTSPLLTWGLMGSAAGGVAGAALGALPGLALPTLVAFGTAMGGIIATLLGFWPARQLLKFPVPTTFWGWLCTLVTVLLCVGFAANSFTIWEDEQLLFILSTFAVAMLASSLGQADPQDQILGALNSLSFLVTTRVSSLSRLCREEQMPNCRSSYYASATSSTSAKWQLTIPFAVALLLPSAIKYFFVRTKNYHGSAVIWIGIALRLGLIMVASFWALDAADDGDWWPELSKGTLKTTRTLLAQVVLAIAFAAGYATYLFASPLLAVKREEIEEKSKTTAKPINDDVNAPILTTIKEKREPRSKLIIYGYANTHGTRYLLLPCAWLLALLLVQKPMGQGAIALCMVSILNILEVIDANNLRRSPLGPILLALLGQFYFFKTGHQAALVTIQWESAFIPLKTVQYPWSPLLVTLNTFGPQILCAIAVPAISMWKVPPKHPALLGRVAGSMATHVLFYVAVAIATVAETAWLRRHLMLYRVFMPRMLTAVVVLLLVEFVGAVIALVGVRWSVVSVGDVFGWPE
ncbi:GPI ethanolamine phosphate transferase 3 [Fulvia fulva]|uniref:GPI ethanolamine phosphate transferase 3 n=1 Tax=Passalora fulva TaxID=5499 RepID=A0A9Q8P5E2_PASFU|nr:GPI ethanolamine phosphate transferase 3 [Fulvia fulva]KAK4631050.1 GPI ethanolamine phosphate transferase 3 [Fulvia fulva]KAK4632830.1 GPI ethanolamine phosphate transferase 3 [Fulvia fulva]UJO13903.1 GPI ethanolamine phosphate transferase 3 [Fulvia fulva]WPV10654.1 GPI ethanolamine phosphate transferase 3 [Fulvia fulva]WPV25414.1 GPI ethanolamine phosphate transferase 3 [Fulvia fulva]